MKKRFLILACLTLLCLYIYPIHNVTIGRFEVKSGTRMSIYACGEDPKDWDYIYIASPWLEPIFIERHNLANFLAYTIEAAEKYSDYDVSAIRKELEKKKAWYYERNPKDKR